VTDPNYIELVCRDGGSILVPRSISSLPGSFYLQTRESDKVDPSTGVQDVRKIRRFVRCDFRRVYLEE
jgi:hypothetical protein